MRRRPVASTRTHLRALILTFAFVMGSIVPTSAIDPADLPYADRVHLQQVLIDGGWLAGTADGDVGPKTLDALRRQQGAAGQSFDGNLYGSTLESLLEGRERDPRFEILNGYDLPYNDYRSGLEDPALSKLDLIECQQLCSGDDACMAYTYNVTARVCFLKTSGDEPLAFPSAVSGRRLTLGMESVASRIAPAIERPIDPPKLSVTDYGTGVPAGCTVLPEKFVAKRSAVRPWQAQALTFLATSSSVEEQARVAQAKALLTPYLEALEGERRQATRSELGMLIHDAARLVAAAQIPWQELSSETLLKEAQEYLGGPLDDLQAVELALELSIARDSNYDTQFIPRLRYLVDRHEELAGPQLRQWAGYSAMGGGFSVTNFSPEIVDAQTEALRARIDWAQRLGDGRVLMNAVATWVEKASLKITDGMQPRPGQLAPLLETAKALLPSVERLGTADLDVLLPALRAQQVDLPCLHVLSPAVSGVTRVLMAEGSQEERRRALAFSVLHTLDTGMFGTEPTGTVYMANDLLKLRLFRPDLYQKAAEYLTGTAGCFAGQTPLACMEETFAHVYRSINRGTLALDFQRAAYDATIKASPDTSAASRATLLLAQDERDFGSVARADDLLASISDADWQSMTDSEFRHEHAALQFERAVAAGDDAKVDSMIVKAIDERLAAEAAIPIGSLEQLNTPPVDDVVRQYLFDGICTNCPAAASSVRKWLLEQTRQGEPTNLLWARLTPRDVFTEKEKEEIGGRYVRALVTESRGTITDWGKIATDLPSNVLAQRGRPMTDMQLATVIAMAQIHPHPAEGMHLWIVDFARFMFEADPTRKQQLYDSMLTNYHTLLDEFGTDDHYMGGLSRLAEFARLAGYGLAGRTFDRHLLKMFDEKLGYLSESPALASAARIENAVHIVPAYARLAQAAADADQTETAIEYVRLATSSAIEALEVNWRNGDERAVVKYRELEAALRLAAQVQVRLDADTRGGGNLAFEALQLAMLGDTAISAQAAQRRRSLVDPAARQALLDRHAAQDAMLVLDYYRSEIGIVDADWEAQEVQRRTVDLNKANAQFDAYFPSAAHLEIAPVGVQEAQSLLREDETLLVFHSGTDAIYAMLAEKNGAPMTWTVPITSAELLDRVKVIRAAVEVPASGQLSVDFPFAEAHQLLTDLLGPAAKAVDAKPRLLVVVDGALQSLPLSILPTRVPETLPKTLEEFRDNGISWLGAQKSLLYLPTISSLRTRVVGSQPAARPFAGVGNPQLVGPQDPVRQGEASFAGVYRQDGLADPSFLRTLAPLPETQVEVFALAQMNGADTSDVLVGAAASETNLKAKPLADYRVVLFATHGLVTGEAGGVNEPGLVLSPPQVPTAADDGYLGLSEIMALELNAELVILSACNTAASDGRQSSSGLSGLARAFLTAGAQSVAVTHWSIPSAATLSLNVAWMRAKTANPESDWADALRQGVADMVQREGPPSFAHPANWGAFEIFGAPS